MCKTNEVETLKKKGNAMMRFATIEDAEQLEKLAPQNLILNGFV